MTERLSVGLLRKLKMFDNLLVPTHSIQDVLQHSIVANH